MRRNGSVLLEALTAFAILLALAGVVIPIVQRSRENADRLRCQENLHRIYEGIQAWSKLHDHALPPGRGMSGYCDSPGGKPLPGNLYAIEPGLNALWDKGNGVIKDVNVFRCPADRNLLPPPGPGEDFTDPRQLSYGMTGEIFPTDRPDKVIVADKSDKNAPNGKLVASGNHNHRFTNVLFFDGRVKTFAKPTLPVGAGSDLGSIYDRESGTPDDTFIE